MSFIEKTVFPSRADKQGSCKETTFLCLVAQLEQPVPGQGKQMHKHFRDI